MFKFIFYLKWMCDMYCILYSDVGQVNTRTYSPLTWTFHLFYMGELFSFYVNFIYQELSVIPKSSPQSENHRQSIDAQLLLQPWTQPCDGTSEEVPKYGFGSCEGAVPFCRYWEDPLPQEDSWSSWEYLLKNVWFCCLQITIYTKSVSL